MDFATALRPDASLRSQAGAAMFLRAQRADGVPHLPALLATVRKLDLASEAHDKFEQALFGFGALSLAGCVAAIGFDPANELHVSIKEWICQACSSLNREVAGLCLYALGELNYADEAVLSILETKARSQTEPPENARITLRGIAFRNLAKLNRERAAALINSTACREYLTAIDRWNSEGPGPRVGPNELDKWNVGKTRSRTQLEAEAAWLRALLD